VLALVILGAVTAGAALSATPQERGYKCGVRSVDVYFWPHGHGAIPKLGFQVYPAPHAEIYKAHSVKNSDFLGFVSAAGTSVNCKPSNSRFTFREPKAIKTGRQAKLRCKLPQEAELYTIFGQLVIVSGSGNNVGVVKMTFTYGGGAPRLVYLKKYCKPIGLYS
jgi:hypothetical protein